MSASTYPMSVASGRSWELWEVGTDQGLRGWVALIGLTLIFLQI